MHEVIILWELVVKNWEMKLIKHIWQEIKKKILEISIEI